MKTILIAGLGNPGKKYERTRHNAGFLFLDYFFEKFQGVFDPPINFEIDSSGHSDQSIDGRVNFSEWEEKKKLKALVSIGNVDGKKIILLKPQTFMNLSGGAISAAQKYYKVKLADVIAVHDEIDLPLGTFRFSTGSSSAGHQGVQNIIDALGTKNFTRLRIGVDNHQEKKITTEKYVLGKFAKNELAIISKTIKDALSELERKLKN